MICPQCANEVEITEAQFLSMFTCPQCMAVYFIDISGQPEFGDMSTPLSETQQEDVVLSENSEVVEEVESYQDAPNTAHEDMVNEFSNDLSSQLSSELSEEISAEIGAEKPTEDVLVPDFSMDLNSGLNPFDITHEVDQGSAFGEAAEEIIDFANQDGSVSALSYNLKVTGLDTKDAMALFKEALDDPKFGWLTQDVFLKIKNGQCELTDLNPVQAFVLAKRIQFLDIEMNWTQNVQI